MLRRIINVSVSLIVLLTIIIDPVFSQAVKSSREMPRGGRLSDVKANSVGDILTILISENSQSSNVTNTQTNKSNSLSAEGDFGNSFLKGLTGGISSQTQNQYQGSGQVSSSGAFTTQLTVRIEEVQEDGNFLIRGTREVDTNGEKVVTIVEGVVRPADITKDNTLLSSSISNARIFHQAKGVTADARRPGLFTRIINWIF
jgi:flagellar L-ring protein precursor FlgH